MPVKAGIGDVGDKTDGSCLSLRTDRWTVESQDRMKILLQIVAVVCLAGLFPARAQQVRVIPRPAQVEVQQKLCRLESGQTIACPPALRGEAAFLDERLQTLGYRMEVGEKQGRGIGLSLDTSLPEEGYTLEAAPGRVRIAGGSPAGVFYGIQTLLQQLENGGVRCGRIVDAPRYAWRGFMLDEARHFSGAERVKGLLDMMARYKLNRFHWHLTDAQGWRIEILRYPRLATVGGEGCHSDPDTPAQYYTQEQIRDIVAYAAARHIEIIPEIDMPGHATASNRAYPEYSGGGSEQFPDFTFNVGKEETYAYLTDILREVAGLFPSPWMHIGGDEVAYGIEAWETDPHVQALIRREGLKGVKEAERYFMHRMTDTVRALGKRLTGWDELLDLDADRSSSVIMWWRHDKPDYLRKSLAGGYTTVMCPRKPLYFDFVQHEGHKWGRIWDGFCPLEDVYAFPDRWLGEWGVTDDDLRHVAGIQANAWTELMHTPERVDYMLFPRLCALAESAWSQPGVKDYAGFCERLEDAFALMDRLGIYYFDPRTPERHPEPAGPVIRKRGQPKMDFRD